MLRTCIRGLASLKLAVFVLLGLAVSLAAGTVLESLHDTATAQYYVYRSLWFHGLLALLGVNIVAVMASRWPWKKHHTPFLLAHIGIVLLLVGSYFTERFGLDGTIRIAENQTSSTVDLSGNPRFYIFDGNNVTWVRLPWIPNWIPFQPVSVSGLGYAYDLKIDRYLTYGEPRYSFVPSPGSRNSAIQLQVQGGPMQIKQDLWLYSGDPRTSKIQMGPAEFVYGAISEAKDKPSFSIIPGPDGSVGYWAKSSEGHILNAKLAPERNFWKSSGSRLERKRQTHDPELHSGSQIGDHVRARRPGATGSHAAFGHSRGQRFRRTRG